MTDIEKLVRRSKLVPRRSGDLLRDAGATNRVYTTSQVARFFGRTTSWVYYCMNAQVFTDTDGVVIEPPKTGNRRQFTLEIIRDMALSLYRRSTIDAPRLETILKRLIAAEAGADWEQITFDGEEPDE